MKTDLNDVDDIVIYHASRQTGVTSCSHGNGGCEHLCLNLPNGRHSCACPTHYSLNEDNVTCSGEIVVLKSLLQVDHAFPAFGFVHDVLQIKTQCQFCLFVLRLGLPDMRW